MVVMKGSVAAILDHAVRQQQLATHGNVLEASRTVDGNVLVAVSEVVAKLEVFRQARSFGALVFC